ncbi:MAG: glycosyltransferase family 87 protein [bacterium]|nr:glycosyltransferase family 87 protein [bacterium]
MEQKKYTYSTYACIFVILIALINFGRGIVMDFSADIYRHGPVFPPDNIIGGDFQCVNYMALRLRHGLPLYEERDYGDPRQAALDAHYRRMLGSLPEEAKDWIIRVQALPWNHTPIAAYIFIPLTSLSHPVAYRVHIGALLAALFLALGLLSGYSRHRAHYWAVSSALVAFSYPLLFQLERGASESFVLLLVTLAFVLWRGGKSAVWVGALIALAAHVKMYPLIFLYYFILKKEWRVSLSIIAFVLILILASALVSREGFGAGMAQYVKLYRFVSDVYITEDTWVFAGNHSTYSFMSYLLRSYSLPSALLIRISNVINCVILACVSLSVVARRTRDTTSSLMDFSLMMIPMTVIPPAANDYSLVMLYFVFVSCIIVFEHLDFRTLRTRVLFLLFSLSATLIFMSILKMPIAPGPAGGYLTRLWFLSNKWPTLMVLGAVVWLVRGDLLRREERGEGG